MDKIRYWNGYPVSIDGIVYSKRTKNGFKPLGTFKDRGGYDRITINLDGRRVHKYVHRIVFEAFSGWEVTKGFDVHHVDKDISNNAYDNLLMLDKPTHKMLHTLSHREQEKILCEWYGYNFSTDEEE